MELSGSICSMNERALSNNFWTWKLSVGELTLKIDENGFEILRKWLVYDQQEMITQG